jgi:ATP-dependent helicase/nuclease subunit A
MDGGAAVTIQPGHIAVLFRTLGSLRDYVEAFRRHAIPCQAEGERHFYERQEVLDAINILRAAADPHDKLALVGVLRSAPGGLADAEMAALAGAGLLDYRVVTPGACCREPAVRAFDRVRPLYGVLAALHHDLPRLPVPDVLPTVLTRIPLIELAAASMDRDQAVGNVLKLQDLATELARRPAMTFTRLVREFTRRITEVPEEAEMSMTEDEPQNETHTGVMRLLSMHKAKGLEFPVVILAGLHRAPNRQSDMAFVHHDWSTGVAGVRAGSFQTVGGLYTATKLAERRWAERSRLLYVGMTRAKRKLVLSAGLPRSLQPESFLGCIASRLDIDPQAKAPAETEREVSCGGETIHLSIRKEGQNQGRRTVREAEKWETLASLDHACDTRWAERRRRCAEHSSRRIFLTPTLLQQDHQEIPVKPRPRSTTEATGSLQLGTIAHRLLERWDFARDPSTYRDYLDGLLDDELAGEANEEREALRDDLMVLFTRFVFSPVYRDLQRAAILGREVPFLMPWDDQQRVMSGTIDLLYRLDGRLWIADYKTDSIEAEEVAAGAEQYRLQAGVYTAAIAQSLGADSVSFQLIFLRPGVAVAIEERRRE